jgi:hypothetical protein
MGVPETGKTKAQLMVDPSKLIGSHVPTIFIASGVPSPFESSPVQLLHVHCVLVAPVERNHSPEAPSAVSDKNRTSTEDSERAIFFRAD